MFSEALAVSNNCITKRKRRKSQTKERLFFNLQQYSLESIMPSWPWRIGDSVLSLFRLTPLMIGEYFTIVKSQEMHLLAYCAIILIREQEIMLLIKLGVRYCN